jgi:beta-lactamase regulating signal transducer with metallopeptidase domain
MNLSYTSFLTAYVSSSIMILFIAAVFTAKKSFPITPQYALICVTLVAIRFALPYEFFYTRTIKSETLLPALMHLKDFLINDKYYQFSISHMLLIIYIIVVSIKLVIMIYKQRNIEKVIRNFPNSKKTLILQKLLDEMGIKKEIKLIEIPTLVTPALIGLREPKIIIPKNIKDEDLYYVLLHELEHYKKHHLFYIYILHILCIIYWWNPFIYLLKSITIRLIEYRVDEEVTNGLDDDGKINYLQSIINVVSGKCDRRVNLSVGFNKKRTDLSYRFVNIINRKSKTKSRLFLWSVIAFLLFSTSIIIEPYTISDKYKENTFELTEDSYLVENDGLYDLYTAGVYKFTIDNKDGLEQLPIKIIIDKEN